MAVVLGGMFKQAYRNQIIRKNPVELVTRPRKQTKRKDLRVLNREEQKIFLKYASDSLYCNVYQVALATGLRSGELRALEWEDIDFKNRNIHVTGTLKYHNGEGYRKDLPKTVSSDRVIPMIDEVYKILKQQRKEQAEKQKNGSKSFFPFGVHRGLLCNFKFIFRYLNYIIRISVLQEGNREIISK